MFDSDNGAISSSLICVSFIHRFFVCFSWHRCFDAQGVNITYTLIYLVSLKATFDIFLMIAQHSAVSVAPV